MRKHPKIAINIFIIIALILNIIGVCLFIISTFFIINKYLFNFIYSISNDLAFIYILLFLFAYLLINGEKEYYTNKYAALFMILFPIYAYTMLAIYPRAYMNILPTISICLSSIVFLVISILYLTNKRIYNPLTKEITIIDDNIKTTQIINVILAILYALSLIINYLFIEIEEAAYYLSIINYLIYIVVLLIYLIIFIITFIKKRRKKNGVINSKQMD